MRLLLAGPAAATLADDLGGSGHDVTIVAGGREALGAVDADRYDALVAGRRMPGMDGIELVRRLRDGDVTLPVLLLADRDRTADTIEGLDAGADEHLVMPLPVVELEARLRALARGRGWATGDGDTLRAGDIVVSPAKFRAWRSGSAIDLTRLELKLLTALARDAGAVLTREELLDRVWGTTARTNVVEVLVRSLRGKLTANGGDDPIATVRGVGYRLRNNPSRSR